MYGKVQQKIYDELELLEVKVIEIPNFENLIFNLLENVYETNKISKTDLLKWSENNLKWVSEYNVDIALSILGLQVIEDRDLGINKVDLVSAIEHINDNIKFGSIIKYSELEKIFIKYNLNENDKLKIYDELELLDVKINRNIDYDNSCIPYNSKKKEKNISSSLCEIMSDENVTLNKKLNDIVESNIELFIEYINDNLKYGSFIDQIKLQKLFMQFNLSESEKSMAYDELEELHIKIIFNEDIKDENKNVNQIIENNIINEIKNGNANEILEKTHDDALNEEEDFSFLDDYDENNLDEILDSSAFIDKVNKYKVKVDKSYNIEYLKDLQSLDKEKNLNGQNNIVVANKNLIWREALKLKNFSTPSFTVDDMFQSGAIGLLKAAEKFDVNSGNQFSTYAVYWIKQNIIRDLYDYADTIRLPVHIHERINKLNKIENVLWNSFGEVASKSDLAIYMDESVEKISSLQYYRNQYNLDSLDRSISDDDSSYLLNFITDESKTTEDLYEEKELKCNITKQLNTLTDREKAIMKLRFGLEDGEIHTLEQIGQKFGVTRERVRQIEAKSLTKLRHSSRSKLLKDFY